MSEYTPQNPIRPSDPQTEDDWLTVKDSVPGSALVYMIRKYGPNERATVIYALATAQPRRIWTLDELCLLCLRYTAHQIGHAMSDLIECGMATRQLLPKTRATGYEFRMALSTYNQRRDFERDYPLNPDARKVEVEAERENNERLPLPELRD